MLAAARGFGVEVHEISPREAGERWPLMRTDDLAGAGWIPGDGKANPTDLTQALAKGARNRGARIFERTRVTAIEVKSAFSAPPRGLAAFQRAYPRACHR
jgi:4-methylaminobutanoate oxidase (formaldehyde-forming)